MSDAFQTLVARYLADGLSANEAESLLTLCRKDSDACDQFIAYVRLDRELRWLVQSREDPCNVFEREVMNRLEADSAEGASFIANVLGRVTDSAPKPVPFRQPPRRWPVRLAWLALAACVAALATVGVQRWPLSSGSARTEESPVTLAVLTRVSGAVWEGESHGAGEALFTGWLRLSAGAVQIEFTHGARVVIEGPAQFEVVSDNEGFLRSGKVRAQVPAAAHGFALRGPGFAAVDLGTEFGCKVPAMGASEVHVFAGEVRFEPSADSSRILEANQAVRFDGNTTEEMPARSDLFLSEDSLAERERAKAGDRLAAWRLAGRSLDANPALLLHLDFEQVRTGARSFPLQMSGGAASIVGCDAAEGRWPGKGALGFARPDDRMRLSVPGEFRALTLLAWVRADDLPNKASLLMSDAAEPGEVHWYFYGDGSLIFGVNTLAAGERGWHMVRSQPVLRRELFGAWIFVAATFDEATGVVTHYFNGQPVQSGVLSLHLPLRLGTCEIGNWGARVGDPKWASLKPRNKDDLTRNFHGRIDEFAALQTALAPAQIQQIYQSGKPGS